MTKRILLALALLCASVAHAQTYQPIPFVKSQWFDQNGHPLAGGCLFTYISGTTTGLATYTDYTGGTANSNPVILDSAGRASVYLSSSAYTFVMFTPGGTNCSLGFQLWKVDGINPSANSILATNNVWLGTNEFTALVTLDVAGTFSAGFTSNGPSNLAAGGSLVGTFTGSPTLSGVLNMSGGFTATTGSFSGQLTSTISTGTAPFVIASTTQVANLNAGLLNGCTWAVPCALGSTTPNTGAFTSITGSTLATTSDITDGAMSANSGLCAQYTTGGKLAAASFACGGPSVAAVTTKGLGANVSLPATTLTTIDSQAVTMPSAGCPCRVQISYSYFWAFVSGGGAIEVEFYVNDGTTNYAVSQAGSNATGGNAFGGNVATQTTATYSNGAVVTFTVKAESPTTMTITKNGNTITGSQSYLELKVEQSQ